MMLILTYDRHKPIALREYFPRFKNYLKAVV
jgi:hypothetical protein